MRRIWITFALAAVLSSGLQAGLIRRKIDARKTRDIVGAPIGSVIEKWGPPANQFTESDQQVYVWRRVHASGASSDMGWGTRHVSLTSHSEYRMLWVKDGVVVKGKAGRQ